MAGVLVEAGRGNISPADVESFFTGTTDIPAKLTAPPSGLFLHEVYYRKVDISYTTRPVFYLQ
jgi:tRNA pseudouridine38-40 synthase